MQIKLPDIKDTCVIERRRLVEEKFQRKNGYEADCDVIYGDTDSVMVNFRVKDISRAMELGQEAAAFVSKTFVKPIKLEFEKVCLIISLTLLYILKGWLSCVYNSCYCS